MLVDKNVYKSKILRDIYNFFYLPHTVSMQGKTLVLKVMQIPLIVRTILN